MLPSSEKINMKEVETMFYDVTKDPAVAKAVEQISTRAVSSTEIMAAFHAAEPECQLTVICLLEVSTGELFPAEKVAAVKSLLAKMGAAEK